MNNTSQDPDIFRKVSNKIEFKDIAKPDENKDHKFYCEIHGDKETPDLKVYQGGNWKCFACNSSGGDIVNYVSQRDHISNFNAAKKLIEEHNLDIDLEISDDERKKLEEKRKVREIQEKVVEKAETNRNEQFYEQLNERRNWKKETIQNLRIGKFTEDIYNELEQEYGNQLQKAGIHYGMTGTGSYTVLIPHIKANERPYLITCRDPS